MSQLNATKLPPSACPACGITQDAATQHQNEPVSPRPEDFSVCFSCGAILMFGPELQLLYACETDMTPDLWLTLRGLQAQVRRFNREKRT